MSGVMQLGGGDGKWAGEKRPGTAWTQEDGGSDH